MAIRLAMSEWLPLRHSCEPVLCLSEVGTLTLTEIATCAKNRRERIATVACENRWTQPASGEAYSHSMVAGGFELMSSTTRLTPRTSLVMRDEIFCSNS
jgi:hypothetical protein